MRRVVQVYNLVVRRGDSNAGRRLLLGPTAAGILFGELLRRFLRTAVAADVLPERDEFVERLRMGLGVLAVE